MAFWRMCSTALFVIARSDGPVNGRELDFLSRTHQAFGLDQVSWDRARGAIPRQPMSDEPDAYARPRRVAFGDRRGNPHDLETSDAGEPPRQPGLARCASRIHRARQRQGRAHQRRLGPDQARAGLCDAAIRDLPSPNHDDRPTGVPIDMLILHYTGMHSAQDAIDRLRDPVARVSSHYVVDEDGSVLRLVPEERRAWHAGVLRTGGASRAERPLDRHRDRQSGPRVGLSRLSGAADRRGMRSVPRHPVAPRDPAAQCRRAQRRRARPQGRPGRKIRLGRPWRGTASACGRRTCRTSAPPSWYAKPGGCGVCAALWPTSAIAWRRRARSIRHWPTALRAFQRHWRPEAITGQADAGTLVRLQGMCRLVRRVRDGPKRLAARDITNLPS